jgi:hypothetical protein
MHRFLYPTSGPPGPKTHPYADATYRVVRLADGAFGVEVTVPDRHPATGSSLRTEADAEAWITENEKRVVEQSAPRVPVSKSTK